jgi:hypothetical protein
MMRTKMVLEMLVTYRYLMRLIAKEDFFEHAVRIMIMESI